MIFKIHFKCLYTRRKCKYITTIVSYADHCFNAILTISDFCTYRCKSKIVSEQYDGGHVDTLFGSFHIFFQLTLIYLHLWGLSLELHWHLCWQTIYLNINQLDALNFLMSLFHASTCFEHKCSSSGGQNCTIQSLVSSNWNKWVV